MNLKNTGKIAFLCLAVLLARDCYGQQSDRIYFWEGLGAVAGKWITARGVNAKEALKNNGWVPFKFRLGGGDQYICNNDGQARSATTEYGHVFVQDYYQNALWFDHMIYQTDLNRILGCKKCLGVTSGNVLYNYSHSVTGAENVPEWFPAFLLNLPEGFEASYLYDPENPDHIVGVNIILPEPVEFVGEWIWDNPLYPPQYVPYGAGTYRDNLEIDFLGAKMDYWGSIVDNRANNLVLLNGQLVDLFQENMSVLADVKDAIESVDVNVEVPDVNVTVGAPVVNVEVPDVNVTVDDIEFPDSMIVDTELALEQYVYSGGNPADSEFWPDDNYFSQAWHLPYTGDTAIVETRAIVDSLNAGADDVAANWSLDGGALGEGGGWFEAWIGVLYRNVVVVVNKLKGGLTAFSDVGKSYTLVLPFRGSSITLDWSGYQSVISPFRSFVVFVLWVYGIKDIRNSVAMIFGGH